MPPSPRSVSAVAARLAAWPAPGRWMPPFARHAAVAVVFRDHGHTLEVLLTQRAAREGDPWSGHVAFPGGLAHASDSDAIATARREAKEEVGLDLAKPLGHGALQRAMTHGARRPLVILPVIFSVSGDPALVPEPGEVARTFWVPWAGLVDPGGADQAEVEGRAHQAAHARRAAARGCRRRAGAVGADTAHDRRAGRAAAAVRGGGLLRSLLCLYALVEDRV